MQWNGPGERPRRCPFRDSASFYASCLKRGGGGACSSPGPARAISKARLLARCLRTNDTVTTLRLKRCGLRTYGAEMLGSVLKLNDRLTDLDLRCAVRRGPLPRPAHVCGALSARHIPALCAHTARHALGTLRIAHPRTARSGIVHETALAPPAVHTTHDALYTTGGAPPPPPPLGPPPSCGDPSVQLMVQRAQPGMH